MRVPTAAELQAIISSLPGNIPQGNPGLQALYQLYADARVQLQPFSFPLTFIPAAASTAAPQSFIVDSSAPFMLISQQYYCAGNPVIAMTPTTGQLPNCAVQIVDQQSNRAWQSAAVPVWTIFGSGSEPYFLPQPRLIAANSNIQVTVNNFDTVDDYTLTLVFTGYRYYAA